MPVHDWTRVEVGIFHDFHTVWISFIRTALNEGLLPEGYYALAEQHAGHAIADVLTLNSTPEAQPVEAFSSPQGGGIAVAEAPPRVRRKESLQGTSALQRRTLAIRHVSGHRLIAILEIVSPANKDRARSVEDFAAKVESALKAGVHVLLGALFPPSPHDPQGMHGVIRHDLDLVQEPYDLPAAEPLTLASYAAGSPIDVYLEHLAVGVSLPDMPLFLHPERCIYVPLESTYQEAYRGVPAFWRRVLEGRDS